MEGSSFSLIQSTDNHSHSPDNSSGTPSDRSGTLKTPPGFDPPETPVSYRLSIRLKLTSCNDHRLQP